MTQPSDVTQPIHASPARHWSREPRYRIYADRVELDFRILFRKTYVIPAADVVDAWVSPPTTLKNLRRMGGVWAAWTRGALKLDLVDLFEHVGLQRRGGGYPEFFFFVPEDPKGFVGLVKSNLCAQVGPGSRRAGSEPGAQDR